MGFLDKLFGKSKTAEAGGATATVEAPLCPHSVLVPRWDSIEDMGREDKATHFLCEACGRSFTPGEAAQLRASEAERLASITAAEETPAEEK
jgi:hypothetical protein